MNRRRFIQAVGAAGAVAAAGGIHAAADPPTQRPHILVIHTDQHRSDCLGVAGNPDVRTPHTDALAADGVRFTESFCPYPVCTPSRYSLLCGLYVHEHRGWNNRSTLSPETPTFPRILRAAGYRTRAVGKMHFTPTYLDVGFDEMFLAEQDGPGRWDDDYHRYLMQRGLVDRIDIEDQRGEYRKRAPQTYWDTFGAQVSDLPEEHHSTTWIADRAMDTLGAWNDAGPELLMAGFIKPHHPFDPPAPWHEMYDPARMRPLPGWTDKCLDRDLAYSRGYFPHERLSEQALRKAMAYYYATISQIDHHVGRMVAMLKSKGLYDRTLIVLTGDHGEFLGFHHLLLKGNYLYDPLAKVPLIIKWPGQARRSTVDARLTNNVDMAPTLCRAAGCEPGPRMRGQDLSKPGPGPEFVFSEAGKAQLMVRSRTRKLIQCAPKHADLLFDLEKDPLEMENRRDQPQYAGEVARMESAAAAWRPDDTNFSPVLDEKAPVINQPNVPPRDLSHRPAIIAYYQKKMDEAQGAAAK